MHKAALVIAAGVTLLLPVLATAAGTGAITAMSGEPCPQPKTGSGASAFVHMLLTPGARFVRPGQTAAQKRAADTAAAKQRARDWADLCHYRADNAALTREPGVVLMGDSITDFWREGDPALFGADIVDRGISGQTSSQMLVRFWADVIALHPHTVQILAGTNDVAGNTGPMTEQDYKNNIMAMVALAQAHRIRVLLGAIPPAVSFWWTPQPYLPAAQIRRLNAWLRAYAQQNGVGFVDYYTHLATSGGEFRTDLSNDGVHPNVAGYKVMTQLLQAQIGKD